MKNAIDVVLLLAVLAATAFLDLFRDRA